MKKYTGIALGAIVFVTILLSLLACKREVEIEAVVEKQEEIEIEGDIAVNTIGEVIVKPNVYILDEAAGNSIKEINDSNSTIIFDGFPQFKNARASKSLNIFEMKKGDILVSGILPNLPSGILIKIEVVIVDGNSVKIGFSPGTILDVFEQIDTGYFTIPILDKRIPDKTFPFERLGMVVGVDNFPKLTPLDLTLTDTYMKLELQQRIRIKDGKWEEYFWEVIRHTSAKSTVNLEFGLKEEILLGQLSLFQTKPKGFMLGPIPVVSTFCILTKAKLNVDILGKLKGTLVEFDIMSRNGKRHNKSNNFQGNGEGDEINRRINNKPDTPLSNIYESMKGKVELGISLNFENYFYRLNPNDCSTKTIIDDIKEKGNNHSTENYKFSIGASLNLGIGVERDCEKRTGKDLQAYLDNSIAGFITAQFFKLVELKPEMKFDVLPKLILAEWDTGFPCESMIQTNGASVLSDNQAELSGTVLSFQGNDIEYYGFLVGIDSTNLETQDGLRQRIGNVPESLNPPFDYTLIYNFAGSDKQYYQAFVETKDEVFKGEIKYFTPDESDEIVPDIIEYVPTAISTGDPHLTTMDGYRYSFMAAGEFIALKSTVAGDKFEVQARQGSFGDFVSLNTGIAIHTGSDEICIYLNQMYVNRNSIDVNFTNLQLKNGGYISKSGSIISVHTPNNDLIQVTLYAGSLDYTIRLDANRRGKVRGVLGNFDGNVANDLVTSGGQLISYSYEDLYPTFTDSWRIQQNASLFVYGSGENTMTFTEKEFPKKPYSITESERNTARLVCTLAGVNDPITLENCIADVALTKDETYAKRARIEMDSRLLKGFSVGDFNKFRENIRVVSNASIRGESAIMGTFGYVALNRNLEIKTGYQIDIDVTLRQLISLELISNKSNSELSYTFEIFGREIYLFSDLGDQNYKNIRVINDYIQSDKKHKLRVETRLSNKNGIYSAEYKFFIDNLSNPIATQVLIQNKPFDEIYEIRLSGMNATVHSWRMKQL